MCTLSIIPRQAPGAAAGIRVAANRDESRLRPTALPPQLRYCGARRALLPIDPASGGTWVAASDAGLFFTLMNVYARPIVGIAELIESRARARASRGTIIPRVLAADDLGGAVALAGGLDPTDFEPFRLLLADAAHWAEVLWVDGQLRVTPPAPVERPLFFTSSGLGDEVVAQPRRALFERMFAVGADWPAAQDAYHRNVVPGREFASVWMTRAEARTVSLTVVEITVAEVRMSYLARGDDAAPPPEPDRFELPIVRRAAGIVP